MKSIKIGIAGTGVVASGVVNVLKRNQEEITRRAGRGIEVAVVSSRTRSKAEALVGTDVEIVDDIMAVARHPDVDIVVETMGGYEPAHLCLRPSPTASTLSPLIKHCWRNMAMRFSKPHRTKA